MKKTRLLAALLAAGMTLSLAACGSSGNTSAASNASNASSSAASSSAASSAAASGEQGSLTVVDGVLTMGTESTFPPYEFIGENGEVAGIDAEIAAALAEKLGLELDIKDMAFDSLIPAVQGGSIDVALAGMTVDPERAEQVNFSDSYATGVQVVIVPEGSEIATVDDLEGHTIGVQSGTTGDIYCTGDYGQESVKQFANGALAVAALTNGQVDCVVIDNEPAKAFVLANTGLTILDTEYAVEDYAIAISKDNDALLEQINAAMQELKDDGTIASIIEKYIPAE